MSEIPADGDEVVNAGATLGEQFPRALSVGLREGVEKRIFALQGAHDRDAEFPLEPGRQAGEQRIGQTDNVWFGLGAEPANEPFQFPMSRIRLEHGDGGFAQLPGAGHAHQPGGEAEQWRRTQGAVEPAGHGKLVTQIDA
jgi:hypothetical protein